MTICVIFYMQESSSTIFADVAQSVEHFLGKIKNGKLQQLITLKNHPSFGSCLCGAAGSAQPW